MKRTLLVGVVLVLLLGLVGYHRAQQGAQKPAQKSGPKMAKKTGSTAPASPKSDASGDVSVPDGDAADEAEAPSDDAGAVSVAAKPATSATKEALLTSLRQFATLKSYSFDLDYRLTSNGAELLQLSSNGRVRDHQYTHAITSYGGVQSEVVSNGASAMVRQMGAAPDDWESVETGMEGMDGGAMNPAAFIEALNSEIMNYVDVEHEGETMVNGRTVAILALPWQQQLANPEDVTTAPMESKGKVRFFVDPKTHQVLQWQMESSLKQQGDANDIQLSLTTKLSGFDQPWDVPLPDDVKEYLEWN